MEQYLEAADKVLDAAIVNGRKPWMVKKRFTIKDEKSVSPKGSVYRHLDDSVGVEGLRPDGVLGARHAEEDHRAHAEVGQFGDLLAQALPGVLHHAGQRGDRLRFVDPLAHEQRGDEAADVEPGLGDEIAQRGGAAQAARAGNGEQTCHGRES